MTESELLAAILELAAAYHWRTYHALPARVRKRGVETWRTQGQGHAVGFPDVVLVRDRIEFWELKSASGSVSPEQAAWGAALRRAGQVWRVVYPADWTTGRIEEWLR